MKILQYCQHVLGVGHFFRSLEIARALYPHRVLFLEGGKKISGRKESLKHVEFVFMEPLEMDEEFRSFTVNNTELDKIKQTRKEKLLQVFKKFSPDVFLIELFPFGRKKFRFELIPVLEYARDRTNTMVVCSVRDILVEKADQAKYERKVVDTLNSLFDLVLVHSDPQVITLDETFGSMNRINIPVEYTGYVMRSCSDSKNPAIAPSDFIKVVVSHGGGRVGAELLKASIKASDLVGSGYRFEIFPGVFIPRSDLEEIKKLASSRHNVHLKQFSSDFTKELAGSHLSVSMAGYNTMMDLLATKTPGLVYPFLQNREQLLRATKFEKAGAVKVLKRADPMEIAEGIKDLRNRKNSFYVKIDTDGAQKTKKIIEYYFNLWRRK